MHTKAHVDSLIEKRLSKQQFKRFERCLGPMPSVPGSGGAWDAVVFVHGVVCGFLDAALVPSGAGGEVVGGLGGSLGDDDDDDDDDDDLQVG